MLEHGGGLRVAMSRYGIPLSDWLDLSTGINPNSWPIPALPNCVWQRLPELNDGLETAAASYYQSDHLLATAGSQAAIQALPLLRTPGGIGVLSPTYAEHAHAWHRAGHAVERLSVDTVETHLDRLDVLVVVNPNNPTGLSLPPTVLLAWQQRLAAHGGWLVVDEAFMDATPTASVASHATALSGLIVLRSLGKFFGLAGARVGFVLAHSAFLERLSEQLGPWTVTHPSRWVAQHALNDRKWQERARVQLLECSQRLAELLNQQGMTVMGGTALFQWVVSTEAEYWQDALARRGIWVRRFIDPPSIRFGLPDSESSWGRLESALTAIRAERLREA